MKNYLFKIIMLVAVVATTQSCDDYLVETNPNEISADIFWSNLEESESSLTGVYSTMLSQFISYIDTEAWRSDMAFPGVRTRIQSQGAYVWYQHTYTENQAEIGRRWETIYQLIWRANQLIEGLEKMDADLKADPRWTEQMGQARFFRGLGHFYLHSIYNNGDIIIRDKVPGNTTEFQVPVSKSEEVIKFFRGDLEYAYKNLPAQFEEKTRVDAGIAATILGTSYLYNEEYEKAKIYFDDVINNPAYGYALVQDTNLMFTSAGDFNSESIFEINYSVITQSEDSTWDEESFMNRLARGSAPNSAGGGGVLFVPAAWLTYAYSAEPLDSQDPRNYVDDGSGGNKLRNVSLRASAMVALVNDENTEYYQKPSAPILESFGGLKFSFFKKYTNHDIAGNENEIGATSWKSGKNIVMNRLADVYLMQAECMIQTGDIDGALKYINDVRRRWGLVLLGPNDGSAHDFDEEVYTENTLMNHLMYIEKPLEMSAEGFSIRNIDIRRWGIGETRFKELAAQRYYVADYSYTTGLGTTAKRANSLIKAGESPNPSANNTVDMEYTGAAQFYKRALHDYFPLPANEILNNEQTSN
jgi:hypothetical protein